MENTTVRIVVKSGSKDGLEEYCQRTGSTQISAMTRLVDWFLQQPPEIQAMVQGHVPSEVLKEVTDFMAQRLETGRRSRKLPRGKK